MTYSRCIRFINIISGSFAHLPTGLPALVDNLKEDEQAFAPIRKFIRDEHDGGTKRYELLKRKGDYLEYSPLIITGHSTIEKDQFQAIICWII